MNHPLNLGLIGAGRIGTSHAEIIAQRVPGARLAAVADPRPGVADELAHRYGGVGFTDPTALITSTDVDAVVITASSNAHAELIIAAAGAGKNIFCEKPASMTLEEADRSLAAVEKAGVILQVGFNRRFDAGFRAAHDAIVAGTIGGVQLMRSLTRDPGLADPAGVPPWTIFLQTLIHDFDALLWLNPGAEPVEVYATADALVAPTFKDAGLLDTAVVVITFDNGARAVAEASFSAAYGYDVRAEVFGSAGMVAAGRNARTSLQLFTAAGAGFDTPRGDVELMIDAYTAEFVEFTAAVREGRAPYVTGVDARRALAVALACVDSVQRHAPAPGADPYDGRGMSTPFTLAVCAEMVFTDRPLADRIHAIDDLGFQVEIWDWTTKNIDDLVATGATFSSMTGYVTGNLTDPDGADELLASAERSIPVAARLGIPRLNLHGTGLDSHGLPVVPVETVTGAMWLAAERTLARVAKLGEREGVTFCLENLNTAVDHPGTPFAKAAETLALVEAVDSPHLKLMLDLYHAQIGEGNLIELVRRCGDAIGEIQVADVPGRCEPGTGEINYPAIARALNDLGFAGTIGLEAFASGDSETALARFRDAFTL